MKKRITALVCLMVLLVCVGAWAEETPIVDYPEILASGRCGDSATFTIYNDRSMKVSGTGKVNMFRLTNFTRIGNSLTGEETINDWVKMVTLEEGITEIGNYTFEACRIDELNILGNITYIGKDAFDHARITKGFTIPDGVRVIDEAAFYETDILGENVTLPEGLTQIGRIAFAQCKTLKSVVIPDSVTTMGDKIFSTCTALERVVLPNGIDTIESHTFSDCVNLKEVTIPEGIKTIGDSAFYYCRSLTDVSIPDSVTSIRNGAFRSCPLSKVTLSANVTDIDFSAFEKDVTIRAPKGSYAANWAEKNHYKLETYDPETDDPGENLTPTVGALKYKLSGSNATVTGPKSKNATKLTIPATIKVNGKTYKVTTIKVSAFKGMKKLKIVTIGKNVKSIGKNAFNGCAKLKTITIKTTKLTTKTVGANAFKGINKKATFKVPKTKVKAYKILVTKKGAPKTVKVK